MKRNIFNGFFAATTVIIVITTFFIIACRKTKTANQDRLAEKKYSEFSVFGRKLKAQNISSYEIPKRNYSNAKTSQRAALCSYAEIADAGIDNLVVDLQNEFSGDIGDMPRSPFTLILYSTEGGTITNISSIYAISYFVIENDKLEHHFLSILSGVSSAVNKFNATTDYITHAELDLLAESYKPVSDSFGYAMMRNLDISPAGLGITTNAENGLAQAIINCNLNKLPIEDEEGCEGQHNCANQSDSYCAYDSAWKCKPGGCRLAQVKQQGDDNSLTDPYNPLLAADAYFIRDSTMKHYAIGNKYVDYYYTLSYFGNAFTSSLNTSNLLDHVQMAYKILTFSQKLRSGSNSDILVDSSFRALALSLIDDYRQLSTNSELQDILDDITDDLNHFLNKTRSQVLAEIE